MPEPTALQSADALLLPRWLLPMEPAGALLTGHAVAIRGDTILDVGPTDALERRYDMVVLAVAHREYLAMGPGGLRGLVAEGGALADLRGELGNEADWTL